MFMGPAGTGKSMVALQYIQAVAGEGKRAAVFTFDESAAPACSFSFAGPSCRWAAGCQPEPRWMAKTQQLLRSRAERRVRRVPLS
jgi:hypothetical protein